MKTTFRAVLLGTGGIAALSLSASAFAQTLPSTDATPSQTVGTPDCPAGSGQDCISNTEDDSSIIVTGSRINSPNLVSANPVAVLTGDQIFQTGSVSVGDQLNNLPQLRSTYSVQNSNRFLGTSGLNLLDLRGLGTQRTLVLVNGRRHVGSDVLNYGVSVDINTIPAALIERTDIVTGGASAVYGSDAIAGVVNFVLKNNYDGVETRGQVGISDKGYGGKQFASVLAGKNFADDRGNVTVALEYAHTNDYYARQRASLRRQDAFVVTDTDPAGSDGVSDRTYYRDVRSTTISLGGLVALRKSAAQAPCGLNVSAFTCTYLFQPDGSLVPQTGTRIGIGPNGSFQGGNGSTNRETLALSPDLKRYSANLLAHFEISPALVPFVEAKYVRTDVRGSQSGPFFSTGTTLGDPAGREAVRLDNPYLSTQARSLLTQQILAGGVSPNSTASVPAALTAAQIAAINSGSFRFNLRRNWTDFGVRDEVLKRETYRIVGGVRGDFNDDWKYEFSVNYGEHKEKNVIEGNVNVQRYLLGLDTTRDTSGNIVCRSKLDPASAVSYVTGGTLADGDDPRLAGDIAACVPINPFGQGSVTQAMRDYVLVDSLARGKITQFDILGFVSGDTSGFFNLPGGPIAFNVGGEYRKETLKYVLDDLTQQGYAFYNAIPSFDSPSFGVKEVYGDVLFPILNDTPFFESLTLRANGRISDYKGSTGTVYAYGGEAIWKPIQDVTLRGTYARSVRAPNLTELYSAQGQNFAPGFVDPCSARNIGTGSSTRAANCAAAGIPTSYDFVYSQSLEILTGGNPDLTEESSNSYTLGLLLQPRFIPGLSVSVDYFNITVKDVISSVDAQDIADLCYDSPSLSNPFCGLFQRAGASGGPNGEQPFQILESSLLQSSANFAKLKTTGLDVSVDYRHDFGFGEASVTAYWTHVFKNSQFTNPSDPTFEDSFRDELNYPTDDVFIDTSLKTGKVTFGYRLHWLDRMYLNTYEDYNSINGQPPQNEDYAPIKKYSSRWYHSVRVGVDVADNFNAYIGVDNLTDKMPPLGLTGVGGGSGIYDNVGRYIYTGFVTKF